MKCEQEDLQLAGHRLKRFLFLPDKAEQVRAVAFHYHGQGDYSERYEETMEVFTRQGVACLSTDLPGHGRSEGKRGYVPGFAAIDQITRSNRERCRELCPSSRGPLGILGHSAGGLIALRELLLHPDPYSFSWISAPLIRPEANQNPLLVKLAPLIARLLPRLTVPTGVTPDQCFHDGNDLERVPEHGDELLFHSRVSIGWGHEMIEAARQVRALLVSDPPRIPLLLMQGTIDSVSPPRYLREVLAEAEIPNLRFHELPDTLHEAFADTGKEAVFATISAWLREVLASPEAAQTSPSG